MSKKTPASDKEPSQLMKPIDTKSGPTGDSSLFTANCSNCGREIVPGETGDLGKLFLEPPGFPITCYGTALLCRSCLAAMASSKSRLHFELEWLLDESADADDDPSNNKPSDDNYHE